VAGAFAGPATDEIPASLVRLAPTRVQAFLDRAASSKLSP
jgi:6-phosphogluconolactonase/glucosamine-6-phosphate isomerase/deaminase